MVEAPGTAPGSETLMSRGVYRHSRLPDTTNIGVRTGFLKAGVCTKSVTLHILPAMDTVPYGRARQGLARLMDKVCDERVPVTITRPDKPPVVLMDLGEYQRMEEELQLLRRPANALRVTRSIRAKDLSRVRVYALIKPETQIDRRARR